MDENTRIPEPVPDGYFRVIQGSVSFSIDIMQDDDQMVQDLATAVRRAKAILAAIRESR